MGEGRKKELIESRFMVLDARDEHQTDQEIADFLGVNQRYVTEIRQGLLDGDKLSGSTKFATRSSKREQAEEYLQENPDASNREVASETPVSRTTAGNIKKELEEEQSQSGSKATHTDTQTDEGGSEGDESYNDENSTYPSVFSPSPYSEPGMS